MERGCNTVASNPSPILSTVRNVAETIQIEPDDSSKLTLGPMESALALDDQQARNERLIRLTVGNTAAQIIAKVASLFAGAATTAILSRSLGPIGFGYYSLIFAYTGLAIGVLANWGLGSTAVRDASQYPESIEPILASAALLQVVASALSYACLIIVARFIAPGEEFAAIVIAGGAQLFFLPIDIVALAMQIRLKLARAAWVAIAASLLTLSVIAIAVAFHAGVLVLVALTVVSMVVRYCALLSVLVSQHLIMWKRLRPQRHLLKPMLIASWPIGIIITFATVVAQAPILFLSWLSTSDQIGYFSAAGKITTQAMIIPLTLAMSLYPVFSRFAKENQAQLRSLLNKAFLYLVIIAASIGLIGFVAGRIAVLTLYGPRFANATTVFALLLAQAAVAYPSIIAGEALIAMSLQKISFWINVGQGIFVVCSCAVLIPHFGATGAAIAVLIATSGACVAALWILEHHLRFGLYGIVKRVWIPVVGSALATLVLRLYAQSLSDVFVSILVLTIYSALIIITRVLDRQDLSFAASLVKPSGIRSN